MIDSLRSRFRLPQLGGFVLGALALVVVVIALSVWISNRRSESEILSGSSIPESAEKGDTVYTGDATGPESIIRIGDSLARTIEKLRKHRISVSDATPAIAWEDGKDRRFYQVSRSRTPNDALVFVALSITDDADSTIESMFWDVDFVEQYVPKSEQPIPKHEHIMSASISDLISELTETPKQEAVSIWMFQRSGIPSNQGE